MTYPLQMPKKEYNPLYVSVYYLTNLQPPQYVLRHSKEVDDNTYRKVIEEMHWQYKKDLCLIIMEKKIGGLEGKL